MADHKNRNIVRLLAGGALALSAAVLKRHQSLSQNEANAVNNGVIQERSDQYSETGDDLPDPRSFSIWVSKENEDADDGLDLYMFGMTAPPEIVAKPTDEFIKCVLGDIENGIAETERQLALAREQIDED